jgi:hypothetical protein
LDFIDFGLESKIEAISIKKSCGSGNPTDPVFFGAQKDKTFFCKNPWCSFIIASFQILCSRLDKEISQNKLKNY